MNVIADVDGQVFAYRDGALLVIVRGESTSPFGLAYGPVRDELVDRCQTLAFRGPNVGAWDTPAWAVGAEVSIYKVWEFCPPYEHDCAEVLSRVAG